MSFCIVCSLRTSKLNRLNPEHEHPFSLDLTRELGDLLKFSLNSLMAFTAVVVLSGSKSVLPVVLALLIYSVSLRLSINACFVNNFPALSIFLHVVPLLGVFCMGGVELVLVMESRALAVVIFLLGFLPFITTAFHHGKWCEEAPLPMRMQELPPTLGIL